VVFVRAKEDQALLGKNEDYEDLHPILHIRYLVKGRRYIATSIESGHETPHSSTSLERLSLAHLTKLKIP